MTGAAGPSSRRPQAARPSSSCSSMTKAASCDKNEAAEALSAFAGGQMREEDANAARTEAENSPQRAD